jgi:hypothetical protein
LEGDAHSSEKVLGQENQKEVTLGCPRSHTWRAAAARSNPAVLVLSWREMNLLEGSEIIFLGSHSQFSSSSFPPKPNLLVSIFSKNKSKTKLTVIVIMWRELSSRILVFFRFYFSEVKQET